MKTVGGSKKTVRTKLTVLILSVILALGLVPGGRLFPAAVARAETDYASVNVNNGSYGSRTTRRLYTRRHVLKANTATEQDNFRTVRFYLDNPLYDGADVAVRYKGLRPNLAFCDKKWKGWTTLSVADANVQTTDGSGESVAFFRRSSMEACWKAGGGDPNRSGGALSCDWMFAVIDTAAADTCEIIEIVMLGGAERIDPFQSAKYHKKTGLTADEIAREMQAGYNLAGHFEANWVPSEKGSDGSWGWSELQAEAHWSRGVYVTRATIANLRSQGFRAIRMPVTWFQHIYPKDNPAGDCHTSTLSDPLDRYHIDRAWMERVHEVVDWCIAEDLYVIINIHHEDWIDRSDLHTAYDKTDLPVEFQAVWTQIANEFAGYDQHLVFEDMNEPHAPYQNKDGSENWGYASEGSVNAVNRLNADFVTLMRSTLKGHEERLLMLAHDTGSGEIAYTGFQMPQDARHLLACSVHCYSPHNWTHYLMNADANTTGEENVYSDAYQLDVESAWNSIRTRYTARGIPVILGEFGCGYYTEKNQAGRKQWMEQYATHAKELGIPLFYWRMDRAYTDSSGEEHVRWTAFDEEKQELSSLSKEMIQRWLSIVGDDSVLWGIDAKLHQGEYETLAAADAVAPATSGVTLPATIQSPDNTTTSHETNITFLIGWDSIKKGAVAVRYTGNAPRLQMMKNWDGDWWGIAPDVIDYETHTAYFSADTIQKRWAATVSKSANAALAGATAADISRIGVRTADSGSNTPTDAKLLTTVEAVGVVDYHSWGKWTKKRDADCENPAAYVKTCSDNPSHVLTCSRGTALGHDWNTVYTVDVEATATSAGEKSIHCRRCNARKDITGIEPTGASSTDSGSGDGGTGNTDSGSGGDSSGSTDSGSGDGSADDTDGDSGSDSSGGTSSTKVKVGDTVKLTNRTSGRIMTLKVLSGGRVKLISYKTGKKAENTVTINTIRIGTKTYKVSTVGNQAFAGAAVKKIVVGKYVTSIGSRAFAGVSNLQTVVVGDNVVSMGGYVFKGNSKLSAVSIGRGLEKAGYGVFSGCTKLQRISLGSNRMTKTSLTHLLAGSKVKTVKLKNNALKMKKKYRKWVPRVVFSGT